MGQPMEGFSPAMANLSNKQPGSGFTERTIGNRMYQGDGNLGVTGGYGLIENQGEKSGIDINSQYQEIILNLKKRDILFKRGLGIVLGENSKPRLSSRTTLSETVLPVDTTLDVVGDTAQPDMAIDVVDDTNAQID
ncbi:hypothetical protein F8388_009818 [Cannabis sativa]|uniref:Uncharacterized protein n=1 Tax=Cannabis sativa TaxID=3483 RepID=A0A7J6H3I2_CANSA|nr:hypothetical protein F8388_009818 [Cannabis sativa]